MMPATTDRPGGAPSSSVIEVERQERATTPDTRPALTATLPAAMWDQLASALLIALVGASDDDALFAAVDALADALTPVAAGAGEGPAAAVPQGVA